MKTHLGLSLALLLQTMIFAQARSVATRFLETVNSNAVAVTLIPVGETPEWMAVVVQTNDPMEAWQKSQEAAVEQWQVEVKTNHNARLAIPPQPPASRDLGDPQWLPFKTNLIVDLGPGDGRRELLFNFRYNGESRGNGWNGGGVVVRTPKRVIVITDPKQKITSRPIVQLHGYFNSDARQLKFDLYNQMGMKTIDNENALVTDTYYDRNLSRTTTNYFQCFDVPLSQGTNTFVFHGEDFLGNQVGTNFVLVFSLAGDTHPPVITPKFPLSGAIIDSDTLTVMGALDNPTAQLTGQLSANGHTQNITFRVGRMGDYYSANEPTVAAGANQLILTATDAAGNSSTTNMVVYGGEARVSLDPFDPFHPVGPWITVTGKVSAANYSVWVNGVQATVKPDGTWRAEKLPDNRTSENGWIFEVSAVLPEESKNENHKLNQLLSAQAALNTNTLVLNASSPACGVFQVHLTGTSGRSFILEASTNLVAWTPILTNSNPNSAFDYTDTNANNYHCRFFRVVPLP